MPFLGIREKGEKSKKRKIDVLRLCTPGALRPVAMAQRQWKSERIFLLHLRLDTRMWSHFLRHVAEI